MSTQTPPQDYDNLIRLIHDRYDGMSRSHQKIAEVLTQSPNEVAVKSVNGLAEECGIHASNLVRFAQAFGYSGFSPLQDLFRKRLSRAAAGFEARLEALEADLARSGDDGGPDGVLRDLAVRDIASLQGLIADIDPKDVERAARMLARADTIFLVGQLRSAPVVVLLQYVLTMLGKKSVLLDETGGLATHRARLAREKDLLFVVSFRFYANEVVNIAQESAGRGVPVVAISDSTLSPVMKSADLLFAVPEHEYTFSRSLAGPMCLAQAITVALAAQLQKQPSPRIPTVTQP